MPTATEYSQAIQNLHIAVHDEELKAGEIAVNPMGLPLQYSGNFAVVFQVHCPHTGNDWAVKCFTKEVQGLHDRYRAISEHLERTRLPFMVDFQYQDQGILVGNDWRPILKMRWVEGVALNRFVAANVGNPKTLRQLLGLWVKLAQRLREAEVTHADLQHGNVLLVPAKDREGHRLTLVDYDGMYVLDLANRPSGELGHPAYQHPQRLREGVYSAEVDRFSHLAIYCAVRSLMGGGRKLWDRYDNGDNLLFRDSDFASPSDSDLFHRLWAARDEAIRALVGHLILATEMPLNRVPLLDEVVTDVEVRSLDTTQEQRTVRLLRDGRRVHPTCAIDDPPFSGDSRRSTSTIRANEPGTVDSSAQTGQSPPITTENLDAWLGTFLPKEEPVPLAFTEDGSSVGKDAPANLPHSAAGQSSAASHAAPETKEWRDSRESLSVETIADSLSSLWDAIPDVVQQVLIAAFAILCLAFTAAASTAIFVLCHNFFQSH